MEFQCSECRGLVVKKGRILICTKCDRTIALPYGKFKIRKEIDLNDKTKDKEVLFG